MKYQYVRLLKDIETHGVILEKGYTCLVEKSTTITLCHGQGGPYTKLSKTDYEILPDTGKRRCVTCGEHLKWKWFFRKICINCGEKYLS